MAAIIRRLALSASSTGAVLASRQLGRIGAGALIARAAAWQQDQRRLLNVHEHVAHELLREFNIPVPRSGVAFTEADCVRIAKDLGANDVVLKAQILAGGRGLGTFANGFEGGVHLCFASNVKTIAHQMLGNRLITKQTPKDGLPVTRLLVTERYNVVKEAYFAIVMDRETSGPMLVASSEGGVDIETVAKRSPAKIHKMSVDIVKGPDAAAVAALASKLGFDTSGATQAAAIIKDLYKLFLARDCTQVEINPMAQIATGQVMCMDAKLNFDDNASFRQGKLFETRDESQEDPREVAAGKHHLSYVGLTGNVGCLVNGAGLAMATMDIIKLHGGWPANFLDVGGGANKDQVKQAFKILTSDPNVQCILVNIFGGIMRCDVIAEGIIAAAREINLQQPVIVRLQGTAVDAGRALLEKSQLQVMAIDDFDKAAEKAVKLATLADKAKEEGFHTTFKMMH
eukprot:c25713_g1_i1.p1 GENE.c25713_g1_i1~~c25713_g1_i1.p1  ORF type:complete len:469 (+),score=117.17 c25713_g1_i1:38-1408(+)